jgi:para-nitrobenzyl esterase
MKSDRRKFIQVMGTGAAGLTIGTTAFAVSSCKSVSENKKEEDGQVIFIGDNIAVAETVYGKVRGFIHKGIYNFLGIPYGANTTGKNRFMPPQKPDPWKDIYPAVYWPNATPQMLENFYADKYSAFTDYWHYDDLSENCLGINVWTPGYNDNVKRPVLLWIHGGGFMSGNSIEHPQYHGENLSRKEDIVFCSLNHRLGPLGFSDFSGVGGEKYAASGNVGVLDIVAALEWIHNNIENFGGDPGNVTIMGQSGGGAKVCTLVSMFPAKGLFHKAVALSGNITGAINKEFSVKMGAYILKEAGLSASQIEKLHDMPWRDYYAIAMRASDKINKEMGGSGMMRGNFGPVADEINLPKGVFFSDSNDYSAQIPMIISSTFYERSPSAYDSSLENITLDEAKDKIKGMRGYSTMGENVSMIVDAYAKNFPDKKPIEILSMILSNRKLVMDTVEAKIKQPAPVYVAWFGWNTPLFDGRLRAFHTMDIGFWFYNTDVHISHTGGGARPRKLAAIMSSSLVKFMKTGDPNGGGLPDWPEYTSENGATMILDDVCEVKKDPDREARKSLIS